MRLHVYAVIPLLAVFLLTCKDGGVAPPTGTASSGSPWPTFHGNFQRTGQSPFVGPQIGVLAWTHPLDSLQAYSSPAIGDDGTIYIAATRLLTGGYLYALSQDGTILWQFPIPAGVDGSPTIGRDNTIYIGAWDGTVYALTRTGALRWSRTLGGAVSFSAAGIDGNGCLYFSATDSTIYSLDNAGNIRWTHNLGARCASSPTIGVDNTIYTSTGRSIFAFKDDGTLRWARKLDSTSLSYPSPACGLDNVIYVLNSFSLYALNPDGTIRWAFPLTFGLQPGTQSPAISSDGTIYFSNGNQLYALNSDGSLKWQRSIGATYQTMGSSPAIGADGTVYVGALGSGLTEDNFFAFDPSGAWKFHIRIPAVNGRTAGIDSSPAISATGEIYVGSDSPPFGIAKMK